MSMSPPDAAVHVDMDVNVRENSQSGCLLSDISGYEFTQVAMPNNDNDVYFYAKAIPIRNENHCRGRKQEKESEGVMEN